MTDISYIRSWQGWLYLAVVVDLLSRKVVGRPMKPSLAKKEAAKTDGGTSGLSNLVRTGTY